MKLIELNEAVKAKTGLGLSLSKMKAYKTCPNKYFLQYVKKVTIPKSVFNPKFFKIGQFAHKWIESKITGLDCKFDSTTLTDADKDGVKGNCKAVFENEYIKNILDAGTFEVEKPFSLNITPEESDGWEADSTFIKKADFHGYIDLYSKIGNTLHIIDWKTGKRVTSKDDETFKQLFLYAKACQKLDGGSKFKLSFFYVDANVGREGKKQFDPIVTMELSLAELDKKIADILSEALNIPTSKNANAFSATPGWFCQYCPFFKMLDEDDNKICEMSSYHK